MEGLGGVLVIWGVGLLLVGLLVGRPEAKRAQAAGYNPGFFGEWATAFIRFGCIATPIGGLLLLLSTQ